MKKKIKIRINTLSHQIAETKKELARFKYFLAMGAIYFLAVIGFVGAVITIFIDQIRTIPVERGWFQIIGIGLFIGIFMLAAALISLMRSKR
jgi:hypothetical protein